MHFSVYSNTSIFRLSFVISFRIFILFTPFLFFGLCKALLRALKLQACYSYLQFTLDKKTGRLCGCPSCLLVKTSRLCQVSLAIFFSLIFFIRVQVSPFQKVNGIDEGDFLHSRLKSEFFIAKMPDKSTKTRLKNCANIVLPKNRLILAHNFCLFQCFFNAFFNVF